ncbi:MAG: hypothetical protein M5U09_19920 [Gammaproteobacteria bacterium]|nr:hypothetical protein [Gammaproteobacteria bacterium]
MKAMMTSGLIVSTISVLIGVARMKDSICRGALLAVVLTTFPFVQLLAAEDRLSADQVRDLLVGNTETGTYRWRAVLGIPVARRKNQGKWQNDRYEGSYEILPDGCLSIDYDDGSEYDGCYYIEEAKPGEYRILYPSGKRGKIKILTGNPGNL